jgi:polar amino acid transport system substrate-binding protein
MNLFARILKIFLPVALVFLMVQPALGGKLQRELMSESVIEDVLKRGTLRVGMSTFVPWAMKDKTGKLVGFEIDVATRLANDMGVKVEFVPTKWAGIIPALLSGKFDVIIGGMGILPQRNLKVNFSIPYDYTGMSMVAHRDVAKGFTTLADFDRADVTLAVRMGSTAVTAAKAYMPKASLRMFDDESQAYQELINGRVHGVVGSAPTPAFQALKYREKLFLPLTGTFTREPIGFAVRKGDMDTLNYFNNWIRYVESEGWLAKRKHYWFEDNAWENMVK